MLLDYFLKYVKVDTQSSEESESTPSTKKQLELSKILLKDLEDLNIPSYMDEFGQVHAFLEGEKGLDIIGFNAHIDTATEISGANVKPRVIENYDGKDIKLNDTYITKVSNFPFLNNLKGKTLVVTDGTTLLGADDKAGLAIIMSLLKELKDHPEYKHHPISILFTLDEEVGRGSEHFDAKEFKAAYAFSLDGASPKKVSYENFNAAHALVTVKGVSIHPGDAKGKMVNANNVLIEFDNMLPNEHVPSKTEKYEGFHHMTHIESTSDNGSSYYILRDHDAKKLDNVIALFEETGKKLQEKYPTASIEVKIGKDYRNMKECFDKDDRALRKLEKAYNNLNIDFEYEPIRGGTDGATFSFLGCPTPNLGTGSYNHHGRYELLVKEESEQLVKIIKEIVKA